MLGVKWLPFYINNSLHLARKYARIFVRGHYLFREANSFPRAKLEENCELRGQMETTVFSILQILFRTVARAGSANLSTNTLN